MSDLWARFVGVVQGGKIRFGIVGTERLAVTMRAFEGKHVEMALRPERQNRNLPQNAKLDVLARAIAEHSGESMDRIKRLAVLETLGIEAGTEKEIILGKEITIVKRTSELGKEECSRVLDWMVDRAAFLEIPEPNWDEVEVMA